jgi:pimeloyl-ACP methyl ester carboxylesterase
VTGQCAARFRCDSPESSGAAPSPRSDQDALAATIAGSKLLVYRGIGHAIHWEEPERFAADLAIFTDNLIHSGKL